MKYLPCFCAHTLPVHAVLYEVGMGKPLALRARMSAVVPKSQETSPVKPGCGRRKDGACAGAQGETTASYLRW